MAILHNNKPNRPMGWWLLLFKKLNNKVLRNKKFTKSSESDPMLEASGSPALLIRALLLQKRGVNNLKTVRFFLHLQQPQQLANRVEEASF